MTTECEYCARDSGIYDHKRRCCQTRQVANMPPERRQRYYDQIHREQGKEAVNQFLAEVNAIRQKRRAEKLKQLQGGKA